MPYPPSRKKPKRDDIGEASLTLTSLMDMFTIILLFLLINYSTEGEITASDSAFRLPVSTSRKAPDPRLIIQVAENGIMVDGSKVAETKDALNNSDYVIKPLLNALNNNTRKIEFIAKNGAFVNFKGEAMIQGDRKIPFVLIEKVMFTCGQAGYGNISLAVMSSE